MCDKAFCTGLTGWWNPLQGQRSISCCSIGMSEGYAAIVWTFIWYYSPFIKSAVVLWCCWLSLWNALLVQLLVNAHNRMYLPWMLFSMEWILHLDSWWAPLLFTRPVLYPWQRQWTELQSSTNRLYFLYNSEILSSQSSYKVSFRVNILVCMMG